MSRLALLALALVLAGCGGDARGAGTATLWVTRDRGAHLLYEGEVPAGLTAMQALDRKLDVDTRYGGRFVQAIDGVKGDAGRQRDWFWYVNGIEGDRSAAEYRLHNGDVEWWDYRSWRGRMRVPVVVGAFPEPFLHGYGGHVPAIAISAESPRSLHAARALRRVVGDQALVLARWRRRAPVPLRDDSYFVDVVDRQTAFRARLDGAAGLRFTISARDAQLLADDPTLAKMRFEGLRG